MNETDYFCLSLRERLKARAPSSCGWFYPGKDPRFKGWQMIFRAPNPDATPSHQQRIFTIEEGHGLRVEPARKYLGDSRSYSPEWNANEYGDTVVAYIIRLPKRKGLLVAASDPFNNDCYTVDNVCPPWPMETRPRVGQQYTFEQANQDAARLACGFAEKLAKDYRDDAEHQTALAEYEEKLHPLEKAKKEAEARRDEAEQERAQAQAEAFSLVETAAGFGTQATPQEREQIGEAIVAAQARADQAEAERDAAQDAAADIQDQIDNLEEPAAPNFYYFGKAKR